MQLRKKTYTTIDDVLLAPGGAVQTIEALREQVYHMQKKLRKRNRQVAANRKAIHDAMRYYSLFDAYFEGTAEFPAGAVLEFGV